MRIKVELRDYGGRQELHVDGLCVLAGDEIGAREALEAVSELLPGGMEFMAGSYSTRGMVSLFEDARLPVTPSGAASEKA